ncbi:hypothetical protein V6U90_02920 [Micromonospora sp. CPCC 206060]|uniref:hypothetical protein n=1 Tax=Micromonospora sp. CPCC 206060 TaxID=3122406 RepID=UPI002FF28B5B
MNGYRRWDRYPTDPGTPVSAPPGAEPPLEPPTQDRLMVPAQRPAPAGEQTRLRLVPPAGDTEPSRHLTDEPTPHVGEEPPRQLPDEFVRPVSEEPTRHGYDDPARHIVDGPARHIVDGPSRYAVEESARHAHGQDEPPRTVEPSAGPTDEPAGWREAVRPASAPPAAQAPPFGPVVSGPPVPPEPAIPRGPDRPAEGAGPATEQDRPRWAGAFGEPVNRHEEPPARPDEARTRHGAEPARPQQSGWAPPWATESPQPTGRRARSEWSPGWYPQPSPSSEPEPEQPYAGYPEPPTPAAAAGQGTGPSYPEPPRAPEGREPGPTRPSYIDPARAAYPTAGAAPDREYPTWAPRPSSAPPAPSAAAGGTDPHRSGDSGPLRPEDPRPVHPDETRTVRAEAGGRRHAGWPPVAPGGPAQPPTPAQPQTPAPSSVPAGPVQRDPSTLFGTRSAGYTGRRSAPDQAEPVPAAASPEPAVLPQRVPAEPDVPVVPDLPAVEPPAETPELARIATHLRREDEPPPLRDRPEGFDVKAILGAVRGVAGVRDASLRTTPAGAHSLRLDLADGADPAEVSRQVARLLQERMGLAAAPQNLPGEPAPLPTAPLPTAPLPTAPPTPRRAPEEDADPPVEVPRRRRRQIPTHSGRASVADQPRPFPVGPESGPTLPGGATGSPVAAGTSYSGAQLTTTESAPSRPLNPDGPPGPRVVLDHVQVSTFGLDATVEVRLLAGAQTAAGLATGPAVDGYVLRLCAVAAASAVDELLRGAERTAGSGRCFVEHAAVVPFGNCEVATVVVLLVCDGWVEQLAGSALVSGDPRQAVVRATLAAVNRRLEALLA